MNSKYLYSEPGEKINEGNILIETTEKGKFNDVKMTLNYSGKYNLKQNGLSQTKILSKSSQPYDLYISNNGGTPEEINIEI